MLAHLLTHCSNQTSAHSDVIGQIILHPQRDTVTPAAPAETRQVSLLLHRLRITTVPVVAAHNTESHLVRGSEPRLLIGCWGRHCVKSKVMTAADGLSARQGYSHNGCGSASRDSRKSKEFWW